MNFKNRTVNYPLKISANLYCINVKLNFSPNFEILYKFSRHYEIGGRNRCHCNIIMLSKHSYFLN